MPRRLFVPCLSMLLVLAAARACQAGSDLRAVRALVREERVQALSTVRPYRTGAVESVRLSRDGQAPREAGSAPAPLTEDRQILQEVLAHRQRFLQGEHSLDVNGYIQRHLSGRLMEYLLRDETVRIRVVQASVRETIDSLAREGFGSVELLPANENTDFDALFASNPRTGEVLFVVCVLEGRSPVHEALANLLYYRERGQSLDPSRITVLLTGRPPAERLASELRRHGIDPDVVVFAWWPTVAAGRALASVWREARRLPGGSSEASLACPVPFADSLGQALQQRPRKELRDRELSARLYEVGRFSVLSVNISPELFGDRSGELVRAVQSLSPRRRAFVFVGTAGSLSSRIHVSDYVVPQQVGRANGTGPAMVLPVSNLALGRGAIREIGGRPVHRAPDLRHVAVDTILYEDRRWLDARSVEFDRAGGASVVDVEGHAVATAVAQGRDALFLVFRISDEPVSRRPFTDSRPGLRREESLSLLQVELLDEAIRELLAGVAGDHPAAVDRHAADRSVAQQRR